MGCASALCLLLTRPLSIFLSLRFSLSRISGVGLAFDKTLVFDFRFVCPNGSIRCRLRISLLILLYIYFLYLSVFLSAIGLILINVFLGFLAQDLGCSGHGLSRGLFYSGFLAVGHFKLVFNLVIFSLIRGCSNPFD